MNSAESLVKKLAKVVKKPKRTVKNRTSYVTTKKTTVVTTRKKRKNKK